MKTTQVSYLKLNDVIKDCIQLNLKGFATDAAIQSFGGNFIEEKRPVLAIEVQTKEILLRMMQEARSAHIYISAGIFYMNALYSFNDHFPAARIYFMKTENLLLVGKIGVYIEKHGIKLSPVNDASFSKLIDDAGYVKRYEVWRDRWNTDARSFDGLLGGRRENTAIEQGIWLSSDGRCLVCGVKTDRMATSTVWGESGMMVGLQLCLIHEAESKKQSTLLDYLAKHLGGTVMFSNTRPRTSEEALEQACEILKEKLECTVIKVEDQTVTARRASGVTVIVRQHSPSNYAYNILSPEGRQLSRVDSANHHKVPYGPDHVHPDLSRSNKNIVKASFTYGEVGLDVKLLLKLIQKAESKLSKNQ
jgi:hypothetical protein